MKYDEKPFLRNKGLLVLFSVSNTLENKMKSAKSEITKHKIFKTPEWYQRYFFINSLQSKFSSNINRQFKKKKYTNNCHEIH